ncbi:MAG: transporter substrate-binding domain-containing protein [Scytonema sp. PMC 1069.18]|nr:transporter substrate-binding domain-containing protein [Scytonema sp. PMC 1069.18]MEC4887842.1 transporter substrate-binding domain-containing protein [Scytonema sp. PMC 1070.18]
MFASKKISDKISGILLTLTAVAFPVVFFLSAPASAQSSNSQNSDRTSLPETQKKLRVGVTGAAPFVTQNGSQFQGISLDIWREVTKSAELDYELIPQPNVPASLDGLLKGNLDVVIGPLSITAERRQKVQFTQPFFIAEIGVLLPGKRPSLWSRFQPFFGTAALSSIGFLCFSLFVVGNLIWLAERRHNSEQFPKTYLSGVGNGMWFALVTLTTVGYGDRAPTTKAGRFITGVWMIVTLITVSSLTAGLASAFTLSLSNLSSERFQNPEDLRGARIAVISGTTGVQWGKYYRARLIEIENLEQAIDLLQEGQADGFIFDRPALEYYLKQSPKLNLRLAEFYVARENYGFALPLRSPLVQKLDVALLKLYQQETIQKIENKWID